MHEADEVLLLTYEVLTSHGMTRILESFLSYYSIPPVSGTALVEDLNGIGWSRLIEGARPPRQHLFKNGKARLRVDYVPGTDLVRKVYFI